MLIVVAFCSSIVPSSHLTSGHFTCNELEVLDRCVEILHLSSLSVSCICVLRKSSSNPTRNRTVVYGNYVCAVSELGGGVVACVVGVVGERVRETCGGNKGNGVRWPSAQLQL